MPSHNTTQHRDGSDPPSPTLPTPAEISRRCFYACSPDRAPLVGDRVQLAHPNERGKSMRGAVSRVEFNGFRIVVCWDADLAAGYQADDLKLEVPS